MTKMSHNLASRQTRFYNQIYPKRGYVTLVRQDTGMTRAHGEDSMVCEPHRYLMGRIAGYDPSSTIRVDYGISSTYNVLAQAQYQGNDAVVSGRDGGMRYTPIEKSEYRFAPQKIYDFGAVRSPSIGTVQPIRRSRQQEGKNVNIDELAIIKQAQKARLPGSFTSYDISNDIGSNDYSMRAAGMNHAMFEAQKQDLARTIMAELAKIESEKTMLMHMNLHMN